MRQDTQLVPNSTFLSKLKVMAVFVLFLFAAAENCSLPGLGLPVETSQQIIRSLLSSGMSQTTMPVEAVRIEIIPSWLCSLHHDDVTDLEKFHPWTTHLQQCYSCSLCDGYFFYVVKLEMYIRYFCCPGNHGSLILETAKSSACGP